MNQTFVPRSSPACSTEPSAPDTQIEVSPTPFPLSQIYVALLGLQAPLRVKGSGPGRGALWVVVQVATCGIRVPGLALAASAARGQHGPEEPPFPKPPGSQHTHCISILHVSDVRLQPNKLSGLNF